MPDRVTAGAAVDLVATAVSAQFNQIASALCFDQIDSASRSDQVAHRTADEPVAPAPAVEDGAGTTSSERVVTGPPGGEHRRARVPPGVDQIVPPPAIEGHEERRDRFDDRDVEVFILVRIQVDAGFSAGLEELEVIGAGTTHHFGEICTAEGELDLRETIFLRRPPRGERTAPQFD